MNYNGEIVWFTGLSGSGKTTLANNLLVMVRNKRPCFILDGDDIRNFFPAGFTEKERKEHLDRSVKFAIMLAKQGILVLSTFITPFEDIRIYIRDIVQSYGVKFKLVYVKCSYDECEKRDVKGLYKKVREGKIDNFTGKGQNFDIPKNYDVIINTEKDTVPISAYRLKSELWGT